MTACMILPHGPWCGRRSASAAVSSIRTTLFTTVHLLMSTLMSFAPNPSCCSVLISTILAVTSSDGQSIGAVASAPPATSTDPEADRVAVLAPAE